MYVCVYIYIKFFFSSGSGVKPDWVRMFRLRRRSFPEDAGWAKRCSGASPGQPEHPHHLPARLRGQALFSPPGINGALRYYQANAGVGRDVNGLVFLPGAWRRGMSPPAEREPAAAVGDVAFVKGREKREAACESIKCRLFLRCGSSRLGKKGERPFGG